jgi:hypothetical protein
MKKHIVLYFILSGIFLFSCNNSDQQGTSDNTDSISAEETQQGQQPNSDKIFLVESGYAKFTTSMDMTRELWWDDWGQKQYEENYMVIMNIKSGSNSLILEGYRYDWDPTTKEGTKMSFYNAPATDYSTMPQDDISKYGITFEGTEKIAGKDCEVISITEPMQTKTWMWKGIALKSATPMGKGTITMEAVEVKEESVDASKFQIPGDVKFKEAK